MDARDSLDGPGDTVGSSKPPKPPRPARDPERTKLFLLQVIAVAAVVTAVFAGVTAWQTYQQRTTDRDLYCATYPDPEDQPDEEMGFFDDTADEIRDVLDC